MFLAIDSVFGQCSVALLDANSELISCTTKQGKREQTQQILPMIDTALTQANIPLNSISAIIFNRGPGAFSGIRINTAVAQALSLANDTPCIAVSSLQILAQAAFEQHNVKKCYATLDARMQQVYIGSFELHEGIMYPFVQSGLATHDDSSLLKLTKTDVNNTNEKTAYINKAYIDKAHANDQAEWLLDYDQQTPHNLALVGDGAALLTALKNQRIIESLDFDAAILARVGIAEFHKTGGVPAQQALPVYLRHHAWKTLKEQAKSKKSL